MKTNCLRVLQRSMHWRLQPVALLACALLVPGADALRAASALSFDGVNDYVSFGAAPALGVPAFTLETWFKRTGAGVATSTGTGGVNAIPLVTKGRSEGDASTVDMNYFLGIRATDNVLCADFEEGAGGLQPGLNHPVAGVTPILTNVWYHAAATYDGSKWQLFLNGVLESELVVGRPARADSIQHAALASALSSTGAAAGFFAGVLDEVRIWNGARSGAQIAAGKDAEILSAAGLVGRWGLNEGSGTLASDSAGSAPGGTLLNGPFWVAGFQQAGAPSVIRGPYLQNGTPSSVIVRWRTNAAGDSRVRFGTSADALTQTAGNSISTLEHSVQLSGLTPNTQYFYSVGSSSATLASGEDFSFFTAPPIGSALPTRIWVLGDSGTATAQAAGVRDGYTTFAAGRYADVWLMLGDNAYNTGTDAEYQAAVFNMYPSYLRQSVLWSTIGNHETAQSTNPDINTTPYFNIFSLPTAGEAGGVASGTEKYYSFDYGRIHFVCLDSMTSIRKTGSPMLTWLQADLESTAQDWIIAFFHHPPYTKGSHNSDTEIELTEMRTNVLPLLEAAGVDLVLCGHSHSYERSYLIDGHYGLSTSFSAGNVINGGSGRENGSGVYRKPSGLPGNQGAVYAVAGNGGHVTNWVGGSTAEFNPAPHPAMFYSALHVGSLVIDVEANRLDLKMIRNTGAVDDYFSIVKDLANTPPTVALSSPGAGQSFNAPAAITLTANATDVDGAVVQVDFYANNTVVGTATVAPYSAAWNNVAAGNYALTAVATDNLGATTISSPVNISVTQPPVAPAAPAGLAAAAGNAQVTLSWGAVSGAGGYNVKRGTVSGGPYTTIAANIAAAGYTDASVSNGTAYFYVVSASNSAGESANSNQAVATPAAPASVPAAPANLAATAISKSQINLAWVDNATNETSYLVEISTNGTTFTQAASLGANVTNYASTGLAAKKAYYYRVRATNAAGNSAYSNVATARTPNK